MQRIILRFLANTNWHKAGRTIIVVHSSAEVATFRREVFAPEARSAIASVSMAMCQSADVRNPSN